MYKCVYLCAFYKKSSQPECFAILYSWQKKSHLSFNITYLLLPNLLQLISTPHPFYLTFIKSITGVITPFCTWNLSSTVKNVYTVDLMSNIDKAMWLAVWKDISFENEKDSLWCSHLTLCTALLLFAAWQGFHQKMDQVDIFSCENSTKLAAASLVKWWHWNVMWYSCRNMAHLHWLHFSELMAMAIFPFF